MTWIESLRAQAEHHHACWNQLIERVPAESTRRRLDPGGPHLAWLLAHCLDEVDSTLEAVAGRPRLCAPWPPPGSADPDDPAPWDQLAVDWSRCSQALLAALQTMGPADLDRPPAVELHPAFAESLSTRRKWLQGHVFHLAYHLGQAAMLRAATERIRPAGH